MSPKAEWYPDPLRRHELRYWDGNTWTKHVADNGAQSTDSIERPATDSDSAAPISLEQLELRGKFELREPGGDVAPGLDSESYQWGQSDQRALLTFLEGAASQGGWTAVGAARTLFDALPGIRTGPQVDAIKGSAVEFLRNRSTPFVMVPGYLSDWWQSNSGGHDWDPNGTPVVAAAYKNTPTEAAPQGSPEVGSTVWTSQLSIEEAVATVSRLFRELPPNRDIVPLDVGSVKGQDPRPQAAYLARVFGTPIAVFPPPSPDDAVVFTFGEAESGGTRIGVLLFGQCHPGTAFDLRGKLGQIDVTLS
jgi:hypothetical protein